MPSDSPAFATTATQKVALPFWCIFLIISPDLVSALFMYLVNWMVAWKSAISRPFCPSISTHLSWWSHHWRQAGEQGSSILVSQRVTQELSDLQKVIQAVIGQDQNRTGGCWPLRLLLKWLKDKRSDSWAVKQHYRLLIFSSLHRMS